MNTLTHSLFAGLIFAQLTLPAIAAPEPEIRSLLETFYTKMVSAPDLTLDYPLLMENSVYFAAEQVRKEVVGQPMPLEKFLNPPKLANIEIYKAGSTPAADKPYLSQMEKFISHQGWNDSAYLARMTIRYTEADHPDQTFNDRFYYLLRFAGGQWKIHGMAQASEIHETGG